ncbi:hypothetical protein [Streptomyces youssoufiensis]
MLNGSIEGADGSTDWIVQPKLVVDKQATVTLDARTTKPVDLTVPDRKAASLDAHADLTVVAEGWGSASAGWGTPSSASGPHTGAPPSLLVHCSNSSPAPSAEVAATTPRTT